MVNFGLIVEARVGGAFLGPPRYKVLGPRNSGGCELCLQSNFEGGVNTFYRSVLLHTLSTQKSKFVNLCWSVIAESQSGGARQVH
jgi:hypothetical protein